jgi:hypothetical protein
MTSKARQLADLGGDTANLEDISSAYSSGALSNRNKIINGAMTIDQRNAGAAVTLGATASFPVDRWKSHEDTDGSATAQQVSDAPAGFSNSIKVTVTSTDASLTGLQYFDVRQQIEGYNIADLSFGTAAAKAVTISFWVKSSVTGTYGGGISNGAFNRSYPFTYSISAADTWEYKTITISGDTSGTWTTTNGTGMYLFFNLGSGPDYAGTAGQWNAAGDLAATGTTNLIATSGATFYITGVQLEAGDTATPFEHRSYGQELALCQRYYYKHADHSWFNANANIGVGFYYSSSEIMTVVPFPVSMRTQPSLEQGSGTNYYALQRDGTTDGFNSFTLGSTTFNTAKLSVSSNVSGTAGVAGQLQTETNGVISFDAEL